MPKQKLAPRFKWTVVRTIGGRAYNEWTAGVAPTGGYFKPSADALFADKGPRNMDTLRFGKQSLWPTRRTLVVCTPFRTEAVPSRPKVTPASMAYLIRSRRRFVRNAFRTGQFHQFFRDLKG